ncbi:MAG TPA: carboxymuconolactone decarboxylase family protein [Stellaceae bacterium]|jgi:4-carboxymuconolactone decarboxylase
MAHEGPNRIREIPAEQLSAAQKAAIEAVLGGRGRIPGPYKIWLHSPILMQRLERLGTFLVTESSLKPREQELAILAIAQHWHGNYVFTVHTRVAREAGIPEAAIEAIGAGRLPALSDPREAAVVEIAISAQEPDPASDAVFTRAIAALGEDGLADLLVFLGYYSAVAIAMKLHRVPVPAR